MQDAVKIDESEEAYKLFLSTSKAMERAVPSKLHLTPKALPRFWGR